METIIQVEGMSCAHCKEAVEGALNQLDGVSRAKVDLEQNNVTVNYKENKVSEQEMRSAIEAQGYDVV